MSKLVATIATDHLMLLLSGYHLIAVSAANESCERKFMMGLWSRASAPAEKSLYLVELRLGDHGLVFPKVPLPASAGVFEETVIKRSVEDDVDCATGQWIAARLSTEFGSVSPIRVCDIQNLRRGVQSSEH